jgi:tetratricopeptide (TPR) repeat protein
VDAAVAKYHQMKDSKSANEILEEGTMNSIGYAFMQKKQYTDAIKIFMLNVEAFPASANVYDSLGEAYAENGDIPAAVRNYARSLELNPENTAGAEKLKILRGKLNG